MSFHQRQRILKNLEICELPKGVAHVAMQYPRIDDDRIHTIEVNICEVRAADGVRVSYDFDRDGWKIEQSTDIEDKVWVESAFIPTRDKLQCGICTMLFNDDGGHFDWDCPKLEAKQ